MRRHILRTEIACSSKVSIRSSYPRAIIATYQMLQGHLRGILSGLLCRLGSLEDLLSERALSRGL